jgi:nitrogen PTS system EIIA component
MNRLAAILSADDVLVDVLATTKAELFERAGEWFERHHSIARATVAANLAERERLGSTGLGHGVAIPHGRIKGLDDAVAAVFRLRVRLAFDAPDQEPVRLVVLLFVPEAASQRHLEILAEIVEMLGDAELRESAKRGNADDLYERLAAWQPPLPRTGERAGGAAAHRAGAHLSSKPAAFPGMSPKPSASRIPVGSARTGPACRLTPSQRAPSARVRDALLESPLPAAPEEPQRADQLRHRPGRQETRRRFDRRDQRRPGAAWLLRRGGAARRVGRSAEQDLRLHGVALGQGHVALTAPPRSLRSLP